MPSVPWCHDCNRPDGICECEDESPATKMHTLTFKNKDATPKTTELTVSLASVEPIMAWYGAYYARDRYKVFLDGQRLQMDQNGEWVR